MTVQPPSDVELLRRFPQMKLLGAPKIGGFKAVYEAEIGGRWEAFKLVQLPASGQDELGMAFRKEALGRIRRETEALAKCVVPELVKLGSVPPVECTFRDRDYVAYSEEFLDGTDLWQLIRSSPDTRPNLLELKSLFGSLLRAIRELWGHGYVHRDIKPANVMKLTDSKRPFVLLDLGIAFSIRETALTYNPNGRLPPATYRYMAPEMASQGFRRNLDFRSDLYSAALTVYEYGARRHPLARDTDDLMETITRALRQPATPLKQYRTELHDEFCRLVDQMLKKKPALRPSNLEWLIATMEARP